MADEGAFGRVYLVKQSEKHFGPAHALVLGRGALRRRRADGHGLPRASNSATGCWAGRRPMASRADGHLRPRRQAPAARTTRSRSWSSRAARSGMVENSWARRGGMDDRIEVYGDAGVTYADLHMGNALPTYSENGYGYAVEKAASTPGLDLHDVRGAVELRLPAGDGALRPLRPGLERAAGDRRRRPGGPGAAAAPATSRPARAGGWSCPSTRARSRSRSTCWFQPISPTDQNAVDPAAKR